MQPSWYMLSWAVNNTFFKPEFCWLSIHFLSVKPYTTWLVACSCLAEEKGTSPQDYRYYLRMWAKEKENKKETIKDLPKMSQVRKEYEGIQLDHWHLNGILQYMQPLCQYVQSLSTAFPAVLVWWALEPLIPHISIEFCSRYGKTALYQPVKCNGFTQPHRPVSPIRTALCFPSRARYFKYAISHRNLFRFFGFALLWVTAAWWRVKNMVTDERIRWLVWSFLSLISLIGAS